MATSAPVVSWDVARGLFHKGEPFTVLLKYEGGSDTKSGYSSKWWRLTYDGKGRTIECNHGASGTRGRARPFQYDVSKAETKVAEKIKKGYRYTSNTSHMMPKTPVPKAAPKLEGVFAEISRIVKVGADEFSAMDKDGNYLLDLTKRGVEGIVLSNPDIEVSY